VVLNERGFLTFALVVCLHAMAWGCSSRSTVVGGPTPSHTEQPPDSTTTVTITPEPSVTPPGATPPLPTLAADDCALVSLPGESVATIALNERIDPSHAPYPSNESERLLFRQLYETLIRADCMGRVVPGLAMAWRLDGDGRTWIVTLREGARFSDGTPVTVTDVRAGWSRDGIGDELQPQVTRLVQRVVAVDDRTLAITLRNARVDMPLALAHPDLAIVKYVADSLWPIGTRSARIEPNGGVPSANVSSVLTLARDNLPPIRFLVVSGDPRDFLDNGVDLLLTRDQAALDYAATLPQFQSVPMPWQRTYVFLTPGRSRSSSALSDSARQVLADDAIRGEARGAQGPFWWEMATDCELAPAVPSSQSLPTPRIVYDGDDGVARDLAERFVGLAGASGPTANAFIDVLLAGRPRRTYQRAAGLTGEPLALARRLGTDAGYIVSVDSRPLDPCRDLQVLLEGARWLDPATIVPLVDTRLYSIVRRGRSGVRAEWDGGLVVAGADAPR
jgi:Bacterial extracellular solute-binding proteins, family 5 Middle